MYDMKEVEKYKLYDIIEIEASNRITQQRIANHVTCIMSKEKFSYTCLMFEFSDILYAHVLKIFITL